MTRMEFRIQLTDFAANIASFATFAHEQQDRDFSIPPEIAEFNRLFKSAMRGDAESSQKLIQAWDGANIDNLMAKLSGVADFAMKGHERGRYTN